MNSLFRNSLARITGFAGTTIVFAASAAAQTPPPAAPAAAQVTCEVDNSRPQSVARAMFSLTRAQAAMKTGSPLKDIRDVVAALNAPGYKDENPVGRAYVLGQAYMMLLEQPGTQPIMTRSALGFASDPTGTIDLYAAADSMWRVVEATSPGCVELGRQWRQQKAWMNVTNQAINALNAGNLDSAQFYATRSLLLDRQSPYAYSVLASVAKSKKDWATATDYWKKALTAAGKDTTFRDVRERTLYDIASATTQRAEAAAPAEKKTLAREVINAWDEVFNNTDDDLQRSFAVQQMAKYYVVANDSASLSKIYAPIVAAPTKFGEATLMQAGVVASQAKHPEDAAKIFSTVLQDNPYQRDALNNLAASYIFLNQYDKVFPIVARLVEIDPSNPENWMLNAYSYAGLLKTNKTGPLNKKYTDSLVYFSGKADKMLVKLTINEFARAADATTLSGTIENKSKTPQTYNLSVDFLDKTGKVLFTETSSVGPVAPNGKKDFTIKAAKGGGVAAYRYKPIV